MAKEKAVSDEQIISALITSGTITEAAQVTGISTRTIYDRMTQREFKASYAAAKSDLVRNAVFAMNVKLAEAIQTISDLMTDAATPPAIRLQAAQTILNNAIKFTECLNSVEQSVISNTEPPLFDWNI